MERIIIYCDSISSKLSEFFNNYELYDKCSKTNVFDFAIAGFICITLFFIARLAKQTFIFWYNKKVEEKKNAEGRKEEKEEREFERKQKSDLLDKYLDFLKGQTSSNNKYVKYKDYYDLYDTIRNILYDILRVKLEEEKSKEEKTEEKKTKEEKSILDLLKELENKNPQKQYNTSQCDIYIKTLNYLIELSQQGKLNEFSITELEKILHPQNTETENEDKEQS